MADGGPKALVRVDLVTGDRTTVSKSSTRGSGPAFTKVSGLSFHSGAAYVINSVPYSDSYPKSEKEAAVVRVTLSTGDRFIVSKASWPGALGQRPGFQLLL